MVIGDNYVFAHLPKTGGDAAAVYFKHLDPGCWFDPLTDPAKHTPIRDRENQTRGKQFYLCGIRRLPDWTWSLMHEYGTHLSHRQWFGNPNFASVRFALSRPHADELLLTMTRNATITNWLPMESLARTITAFFGQPVSVLEDVPTKPGRANGNPFDAEEIEALYDLNPHWARVEERVYGSVQRG